MNWNVKRFSMWNISQVILMRTDSNLCRKELTVHWSAPNSLIRSYLQPCTNSMWGDESEAVAPIIWLFQIVDAQKEEVFFPKLLITVRSYGAVCWAHFMCHQKLRPTSVSHPFSFLNSSWGLTGEKHYQKIAIAILRFVLQNFAIPGYSPYILFYSCLFSLLSSGWFVIAEHRENSPITQTTPEPTLLSWGGWPREKNFLTPGHTASPVLSR